MRWELQGSHAQLESRGRLSEEETPELFLKAEQGPVKPEGGSWLVRQAVMRPGQRHTRTCNRSWREEMQQDWP